MLEDLLSLLEKIENMGILIGLYLESLREIQRAENLRAENLRIESLRTENLRIENLCTLRIKESRLLILRMEF